jgi:hypothetical protein
MVSDDWWRPVVDTNTTTGRLSWCSTFMTKTECLGPGFCKWSGSACVEAPNLPPPPPAAPPPPPCNSCTDDSGCSYNGKCHAGVCMCDLAWRGACCTELAFRPAVKGAGLHTIEADGHNTSSWGGSVLCDNSTGVYHMWAAEMTQHCGIGAWTENSRIIHATSPTADGTYTRSDEVFVSRTPDSVASCVLVDPLNVIGDVISRTCTKQLSNAAKFHGIEMAGFVTTFPTEILGLTGGCCCGAVPLGCVLTRAQRCARPGHRRMGAFLHRAHTSVPHCG